MNIGSVQAKLRNLEEQIQKLRDLITAPPSNPAPRQSWAPGLGDPYFFVDELDQVIADVHSGSPRDRERIEAYNVWPSAEAAEKRAVHRQILNIMWAHHEDGGDWVVTLIGGVVVGPIDVNGFGSFHLQRPVFAGERPWGLQATYATKEKAQHVSNLVGSLFEELRK